MKLPKHINTAETNSKILKNMTQNTLCVHASALYADIYHNVD